MILSPETTYTILKPFSVNQRQISAHYSFDVTGGSIRFLMSNHKTNAVGNPYGLEEDINNPFAAGTYALYPLWAYIGYTANADLWVSTTTYATDATVRYGGSKYKSLVDNNTGNLPTDATKWEWVETPVVTIPDGNYEAV